MSQSANSLAPFLNSWKEIADYLGRGVRTVQRWERDFRLPVHRIGKGKRSPVYATRGELKFWMSTADVDRVERIRVEPETPSTKPIDVSRRLLQRAHNLAQALAKATAQQQRQAEILQARIVQMRLRMK